MANSSATTSANFGHLMVGGKDLGVLDLNATVAQIDALKGSVLGVVNGITSTLGLGNLIDIGLLERTSSVKAEGNYNVANSGLDLLRVSINPPANLTGIISGLSGVGVSDEPARRSQPADPGRGRSAARHRRPRRRLRPDLAADPADHHQGRVPQRRRRLHHGGRR